MNHKINYYVFRINFDEPEYYTLMKKDALNGTLRQGWGYPDLDVRQEKDDFVRAYLSHWDVGERKARHKYTSIGYMTSMEPGDLIVVPKLSLDTDGFTPQEFSLFRVHEGGYSFEPVLCYDGRYDFGHIIPVDPICSYAYGLNSDTRVVSGSFSSYRAPVNKVGDSKVKAAIDELLRSYEADPDADRSVRVRSVEAFMSKASAPRLRYIDEILNIIRGWSGHEFELVIREMLTDAGYLIQDTNRYDREGADVDVVIQLFTKDSIVASMIDCADEEMTIPEIHIQAKNKRDVDIYDGKGVEQLLSTEGSQDSINVLMSTCRSFTSETIKAARGKVILIDGPHLASMLEKYVLKGSDTSLPSER